MNTSTEAYYAIMSMMDAYYGARRGGANADKLLTVEAMIEALDELEDNAYNTMADDDYEAVMNEARAIRAYILNI